MKSHTVNDTNKVIHPNRTVNNTLQSKYTIQAVLFLTTSPHTLENFPRINFWHIPNVLAKTVLGSIFGLVKLLKLFMWIINRIIWANKESEVHTVYTFVETYKILMIVLWLQTTYVTYSLK